MSVLGSRCRGCILEEFYILFPHNSHQPSQQHAALENVPDWRRRTALWHSDDTNVNLFAVNEPRAIKSTRLHRKWSEMLLLTVILLTRHSRWPQQFDVEAELLSAVCRLHAWRLHSIDFSVTSVFVAKCVPHFLCYLLLPSLFFYRSTLPLHLRQS